LVSDASALPASFAVADFVAFPLLALDLPAGTAGGPHTAVEEDDEDEADEEEEEEALDPPAAAPACPENHGCMSA
jgi:hypothetical protein